VGFEPGQGEESFLEGLTTNSSGKADSGLPRRDLPLGETRVRTQEKGNLKAAPGLGTKELRLIVLLRLSPILTPRNEEEDFSMDRRKKRTRIARKGGAKSFGRGKAGSNVLFFPKEKGEAEDGTATREKSHVIRKRAHLKREIGSNPRKKKKKSGERA